MRDIQVDGPNNILIGMQYVADIVRIIYDVKREYQSSNSRINHLHNPIQLALSDTGRTHYVGRRASRSQRGQEPITLQTRTVPFQRNPIWIEV
jgi:hypothetical protein